MLQKQQRRKAIKDMFLGTAAIGASSLLSPTIANAATGAASQTTGSLKGNINHSVCRWTYDFLKLEALCNTVKKLGFAAIDLVGPKGWNILKAHGIDSSMCNGAQISLTEGWNDTQYHATLIKNYSEHIELVSAAGYKNLICFSGNKKGMDNETGLKNCTAGLKQIMALAEKKNVTIQMEVFNSKVNHPDYMADNTTWTIELCKRIGSPNFKILYDIYHMQISEGDIIATIQKEHQYFGHYHTAGVPGRHEIDDTQELNYPAIMKAIVATGYKGYVAQEFITTAITEADKVAALQYAIQKCDV
jgi:hydroxypyruvate isomerase